MSAIATKRFMNWSGVSFTPAGEGATATAITGVKSVKFDSGGSLAKFSGDGDRYNSTSVNDFNEPSITVEAADIAALQANPVGTVGTFAATLNDAKNGAGTGAITYTLANAQVAKIETGGQHRQYGMGTLTLEAFAPDGITNPVSTSVTP